MSEQATRDRNVATVRRSYQSARDRDLATGVSHCQPDGRRFDEAGRITEIEEMVDTGSAGPAAGAEL